MVLDTEEMYIIMCADEPHIGDVVWERERRDHDNDEDAKTYGNWIFYALCMFYTHTVRESIHVGS